MREKTNIAVIAILTPLLQCGTANAQTCSEFKLTAEPSTTSVHQNDPVLFTVTLANGSPTPVTVVARHVPDTWTIYTKTGFRWKRLASGGVVRGRVTATWPENSSAALSDLYPHQEYREIASLGQLTTKYDFTEFLWSSVSAFTPKPSELRVIVRYRYRASEAEKGMNILQCGLTAPAVDIRIVAGSKSGN